MSLNLSKEGMNQTPVSQELLYHNRNSIMRGFQGKGWKQEEADSETIQLSVAQDIEIDNEFI